VTACEYGRCRERPRNRANNPKTDFIPYTVPKDCAGLQAADYFLWALQKFYERGEDRYLHFIWPKTVVVHDVDDTREDVHGVFYTKSKPLTLEARKKTPMDIGP
jgi:hypothetical protein